MGGSKAPRRSLSFDTEPAASPHAVDGPVSNGNASDSVEQDVEAEPLLLAGGSSGAAADSGTWPQRVARQASKVTAAAEGGAESWGAYRHEARRLAALAGPLAASHVFNFALSLISVAFIGRLGQQELSVAVLASSFFNVTGLSMLIGFVGAQETLCGQAFGARNYRAVGVVLQRAILFTLLLGGLVCGAWTQMEAAMLAIGQDPALAAGAARYLRLSMPSLLAAGVFECLKRYLMAQGIVKPSTVVACVATALAPVYNWVLIYRLGLGLDGAAWAMNAAQLTMLGGLAVWTYVRDQSLEGLLEQTWHGWSRQALQGWWQYLSLALPNTCMVCLEWWLWECTLIMSGWLPNPSLNVAVMGICINTSSVLYMLPMGLASATSTRVSNALGAGLPQGARRSALTSAAMVLVCQFMLMLLLMLNRGWWAYIFTNVEEVVRAAGRVFPLLAAALPGDGMNAVLGGVLRGAGRQTLGAAMNLLTFWVLGLPLAALLAFKAGWGIAGLWSGLATATTLEACAMSALVMLRFNWQREAERAAEAVGGAPTLAPAPVGTAPPRGDDSAFELLTSPRPSMLEPLACGALLGQDGSQLLSEGSMQLQYPRTPASVPYPHVLVVHEELED